MVVCGVESRDERCVAVTGESFFTTEDAGDTEAGKASRPHGAEGRILF